MSNIRPWINCAQCQRRGRHSARGLCWSCYNGARLGGTLDQYPPRTLKRTARQVAADQVLVPVGVLGVLLADASVEVEEWAEAQLGSAMVAKAIKAAEAADAETLAVTA